MQLIGQVKNMLIQKVQSGSVKERFSVSRYISDKIWLIYNEQSLNQIAFNLGYSSTQHLSAQFKKLTGMTPSQFKQLGALHRKPIDGVKD